MARRAYLLFDLPKSLRIMQSIATIGQSSFQSMACSLYEAHRSKSVVALRVDGWWTDGVTDSPLQNPAGVHTTATHADHHDDIILRCRHYMAITYDL
jgi:hypothetical protein